jgi:hypothetical protein
MRTLSQWVTRFSRTPAEIPCREMRLIQGRLARYIDPPVSFVGPGALHFDTASSIRFVMHARINADDALRQLNECDEFPYDAGRAFRLRLTDYDGVEWACGLTRPRIVFPYASGPELLLDGELTGLSAGIEGAAAARGFELFFSPAPRLVPFSESLIKTAKYGETEVAHMARGGRHAFEVLGSTIEASRDPWTEDLWLCASGSSQLDHPYIENWLSEPLRVLMGQPAYPRLIAYNHGDGRAFLSVSPCPPLRSNVPGCIAEVGRTAESFWGFYGRYLTYLAKYPASDGLTNYYGRNPLTHYHEEVIRAASGSRWMYALAVASAIEGIHNHVLRPGEPSKLAFPGTSTNSRAAREAVDRGVKQEWPRI